MQVNERFKGRPIADITLRRRAPEGEKKEPADYGPSGSDFLEGGAAEKAAAQVLL